MRYDCFPHLFSYSRPTTVETHTYPKSRVKVGDIVKPRDGSWVLSIIDGRLTKDYIAFRPTRQEWKVLVTEGRFPTDPFRGMDGLVLPDEPYPFESSKEKHPWNDTMICRLSDDRISFIKSEYLSLPGEPGYEEIQTTELYDTAFPEYNDFF